MSDVESLYVSVGRSVCLARRAAGMSQEQLAAAVQLSRASIANIEVGRQRPSLHVFVQIAGALDMGLCVLLQAADGQTQDYAGRAMAAESRVHELEALMVQAVRELRGALVKLREGGAE